MNAWLLTRFDSLRRELAAAGLMEAFCRELRAAVSPDGSLSLFEVIDASKPDQWREARAAAEGHTSQMVLTAGEGQRAEASR